MTTPRNANEFIEQQLDGRIKALSRMFDADALGFSGPLLFGVDDVVRNVIEELRQRRRTRDKLVVVLTTTGGFIEVVARIVDTFRHHYRVVDFVVPNYAFSAGTVLAMSGDAIYMNYYSRLGPIDPQVETASGRRVSAIGYLEKWQHLIENAKNNQLTTAEAQLMIDGFDQAELYQFEQARELSVRLLREWLAKYKFKNWNQTETRKIPVTQKMKEDRAEDIARILNNPKRWHAHGYGISMRVLESELNLKVDDFDASPDRASRIKDYHGLLDDYMGKRGTSGVLHTEGQYVPFMRGGE